MHWSRRLPAVPLPVPVLAALAAGGALLTFTCPARPVSRVQEAFLLDLAPASPGASLLPEEARGLAEFLAALLERRPGVTAHLDGLPSIPAPARWTRVTLDFHREGQGLRVLMHRQAMAADRPVGPSIPLALPPGSPARLLRDAALRLGTPPVPERPILPEDATSFWELLGRLARPMTGTEALDFLEGLRPMLEAHPSAVAWIAHGHLLEGQVWAHPELGAPHLHQEARQAFEKALQLSGNHPRAVAALADHLVLRGGHAEALQLLEEPLSLWPGHPQLLAAASAAARDAGLLDLAARLHARGPQHRLAPVADLGLDPLDLYRGDWTGFEQELALTLRVSRRPCNAFYLGYLRLLQRRPREAEAAFEQASRGLGPHAELAQLHLDLLQDQVAGARVRLAYLARQRIGHQVPDGILSFHLAEVATSLGEPDLADELATRAYAQGFCCRAWYEQSPLLASRKTSATFQNLLQRLTVREEALARRFPPGWS